MTPNPHAARNTLDGIYDALRCGAPLTMRMQTASLDALRDIRAREGVAVERDYRAKLRFAALSRIGMLLRSTKPARRTGPTLPAASRGGAVLTAGGLRSMQARHVRDMQARGFHMNAEGIFQ
jgi:hypothetical protein